MNITLLLFLGILLIAVLIFAFILLEYRRLCIMRNRTLRQLEATPAGTSVRFALVTLYCATIILMIAIASFVFFTRLFP